MKKILFLVFASMCWLARAGAQTATVTSSSTVLNSAGGQVTLTATITYPAGTNIVTGVAVTNGGSGYTSAPTVSFKPFPATGTGTGAAATATIDGRVASITIVNGGSGYTAPTVTLSGGGGTGALATATIGPLTALTVTNGGSGYTAAPTVVFSGGGGSGATATATISGGVVTALTVVNGGANYTSAPTATLTGGGGTGALATATINGGVITGITVTAPGTGYTSAPTVAITDTAGSGAAGTAIFTKVVSAITATSGGSGYANPPTVEFSGGGGTGATADATVPTPGGLAFAFGLPAGWALVSTGGANVPAVASPVGPATTLEYAYIEFPANSATFTVTVSYPSGLLVNQTITPSAIYRSPQAQLTVAPLVFTPPPVAPAITTQPASVTVASGANATFTVVATGTPTPTLKWQRSTDNGSTFADLTADSTYTGVTTGTLAIAATTPAMNGYKFRVVATNGDLSAVTSTAATLSVNFAPTISVQPKTQAVSTGGNLVLSVVATGFPAPTYQWKKGATNLTDGGRISGATTATLTISTVQTGDEGGYSVVVSNTTAPSATSATATITLVAAGYSGSHTAGGAGYTPGGTVTVTNTINYLGELASLSWSVLLPAGWNFASAVNAGSPSTQPVLNDISLLEWAWAAAPPTGSTFTYTVNIPATASGNQSLTSLVEFTVGETPIKVVVTPDPLPINQIFFHTADTNGNYKMDLSELTRVITIYNTRFDTGAGKVRTGCYKLLSGTVDGFSTEVTRDPSAVVTLPTYHAADYNRNGKIDLPELTRVITLYNTRYDTGGGKVRTGYYKVSVGTTTVDGYTTDPTRVP